MKKLLSKTVLYSLAMAMAQPIYDTGRDTPSREVKQRENAKKYSLPCWSFGGTLVYARNEKEAVKRAKKRGVYCENFKKF